MVSSGSSTPALSLWLSLRNNDAAPLERADAAAEAAADACSAAPAAVLNGFVSDVAVPGAAVPVTVPGAAGTGGGGCC